MKFGHESDVAIVNAVPEAKRRGVAVLALLLRAATNLAVVASAVHWWPF